jgi:hypothetical protein
MDELQREFQERLGAAERKVFALTKERDALKRAAAAAGNSSGGGVGPGGKSSSELEAALKHKEELVAQVRDLEEDKRNAYVTSVIEAS